MTISSGSTMVRPINNSAGGHMISFGDEGEVSTTATTASVAGEANHPVSANTTITASAVVFRSNGCNIKKLNGFPGASPVGHVNGIPISVSTANPNSKPHPPTPSPSTVPIPIPSLLGHCEKEKKITGTSTIVVRSLQSSKKHDKPRILPEKEFISRPSLLTVMLEMEEYAGIYNIFLSVVLNLTVYTIMKDFFEYGTIDLGLSNFASMFGQPFVTAALLIGMHFSSAFPFYWFFRIWGDHRNSYYSLESIWDLSFSIMLGFFLYGFYYIPFQVNIICKLPPASASIIVLEQIRLSMKLYAFIRTNVPRVLQHTEDSWGSGSGGAGAGSYLDKENNVVRFEGTGATSDKDQPNQKLPKISEDDGLQIASQSTDNLVERKEERKIAEKTITESESPVPEHNKFLYFLYAPTLIYRDYYPRTDVIRWNFILTNCVELFGCIYFYNLVQHLSGYVLMEDFGSPGQPRSMKDVMTFIFFQIITGSLGFILGFFILLHNTQNISAELLRFGDRQFYLDWWNSDSFASYYRKWNLPVHDFLYTYIYKEAKEARLDKVSRVLPAILVFAVSSLFHEYVFIYVLQVFYPVLLLLFGGFGMVLSFVPNKGSRCRGNLFIWWSLITGNGLIHAFYTLEYFARLNGCAPADSPIWDNVIPRTWTCGAIKV